MSTIPGSLRRPPSAASPFIEQEHIEVLGWYLLCSGDVICEVKDQEQGTEVIRRIFDVVSKGSTAISIDKSGDEISVSNYV